MAVAVARRMTMIMITRTVMTMAAKMASENDDSEDDKTMTPGMVLPSMG